MNKNNTTVVADPTIHATDADGAPVLKADANGNKPGTPDYVTTYALKRGRKPGSTVTTTRRGFDVNAVSAAYLARVMAAGDLDELTRFSMLKPSDKVAFLVSTPEYGETVTAKIVADAAAAIDAILEAAGEENYSAIMELVRFGACPV